MTEKDQQVRIWCWRVYPEESELFADDTTLPSDTSILIRQDEETDEYLKGNVTHPDYGAGLLEATFQKDKLVGWREEVVIPGGIGPSFSERLKHRVTAPLSRLPFTGSK